MKLIKKMYLVLFVVQSSAQTPPLIGDIEQCSDELTNVILRSALRDGNVELFVNILDQSDIMTKPTPLLRKNSAPAAIQTVQLTSILDKKLNKTTDS